MELYKNADEGQLQSFAHHDYMELLNEKNGCAAGCRTGLLFYRQESYLQGGIHEDQEGFYVLEGTGTAQVGDEEFSLHPGTCFIAPANCYHAIKKDPTCAYIKLFFFHAAVRPA